MSVKEEGRELLLACRICLATDTNLFNIPGNILETFVDLTGTEVHGLRRVCGVCRAQLARACALRARARRSQALLITALQHTHYITLDYIRTIDRVAEKLCLNLKTCHVYSSDSTLQEIKLEDVKEETDFTETIFVSAPSVIDYDDFIDTSEFEHENSTKAIKNLGNTKSNSTEQFKCRKINKRKLPDSERSKRKRPKPTKGTKRKLPESTKDTTRKPESADASKKLESTKEIQPVSKTKRVIKRRMADNGFLPDFNIEEFENKYNVKIDILSKEEQMREIEERKMAASYTLAAFGCEICGKGFATKQVYEAHMMKHDASAGAHACGVCGVRFGSRSRALVHADAHRLRFTCAQCGFLTRTRFIAKNHFLSHSGTTHKCPHCDAVFTKYTSYLTHVRRRHPAMNVACDECGETFVGHNGLRHHKTRVHRNTSVILKTPTPCRDCDQTFVDQASFDTHYQRIHLNIRMKEPPRVRRARAFICELCGAECSSGSSLSAHQRAHGGARPHACPAPACARRFATLHNMRRHHRVSGSSLSAHQRAHGGARPHACPAPACARRFATLHNMRRHHRVSGSSLSAHQRAHGGARPHACPAPACARRFATLHNMRRHHRVSGSSLSAHQRAHGGARPHACPAPACARRFATLHNMRRHHRVSGSSLSAHQRAHGGARPHACPAPACARRFATLHNMRRHHRVVHLGNRPQVACGVCGKLLAHAASLKLHVNTVHLKLPAPRRRRARPDHSAS